MASSKTRVNPNQGTTQKKVRHFKRNALLIIITILVVFRLILPYIVLDYVNNKMADLGDYHGFVKDIDLHLYRGAYVIKDMTIIRLSGNQNQDTIPFFNTPNIDLSIEWRAIFKGKIVGEIYVESPVLNYVQGKHKDEDLAQDTANFKQLVKDLMPLTVNHFEVTDGQIHYIDENAEPKVDAFITNVNITTVNLSNESDSSKLLPARMVASGSSYGGQILVTVDIDALNQYPTFDLNAKFTDINLVLLNDVLMAYGNFDVKKGTLSLFSEFAAKNGEFGGYVKPYVTDVEVAQWENTDGNLGQILWKSLVATALEIFQNREEKQISTKIPIKGKFENPNVNIWEAISYLLRNAFVEAFKPVIDHDISIRNFKEDKNITFFQRVFGNQEEQKKEVIE